MSSRSWSISAALGFVLSCASLCAVADAPRYSVELDDSQQAKVQLCFAQAHDTVSFAADSPWAMRFIADLARSGGGGDVDGGRGAWHAAHWAPGECLRYTADLRAIAASNDQDVGWKIGGDIVTAPQLWLLRADAQRDEAADLLLTLPDGVAVSAPWQQLGRDGKSIHFRIPATPPDWAAAVAFGDFAEERIELPGGVLRLTILSGPDDGQRAKLRDWLARVSRAALSAYGRLPLPDVQVLMIPVNSQRPGRRNGAVRFGQSIRGQGNALELLVDASRPASEFDDDWIAVHELSHLMHPYLGERGAWVAEGLATYYQNILRGRSGMLTPAQAWDHLRDGFNANDGKQYDAPLDEAALDMHKTHDYQRIYWSGAAYWLTVDRDLRRSSSGKLSTAQALARFRDCCLPSHRAWKAPEFLAKLDSLLGVDAFSARYREFAALRRFPDWKNLFDDLGIAADARGRVRLSGDARDAAVRDDIIARDQNVGRDNTKLDNIRLDNIKLDDSGRDALRD